MAYTGQVKWFNQALQFGFIEHTGYSQTHLENLVSDLHSSLKQSGILENLDADLRTRLEDVITNVEPSFPKELFVHRADIARDDESDITLLLQGEDVTYGVDKDENQDPQKQYKAVNVRGVKGGKTLCNNQDAIKSLYKTLWRRKRQRSTGRGTSGPKTINRQTVTKETEAETNE